MKAALKVLYTSSAKALLERKVCFTKHALEALLERKVSDPIIENESYLFSHKYETVPYP